MGCLSLICFLPFGELWKLLMAMRDAVSALFLISGETKISDDPYPLHFIPKGLLINRNISFLARE